MASVLAYFLSTIIALQAATAQRFNDSSILPAVTIESSNGTCPSDEVTVRVINSVREAIKEQLPDLTSSVRIHSSIYIMGVT